MRPNGFVEKFAPAADVEPPMFRVEPDFAASRRSLTARSWDSNLLHVVSDCLLMQT